MFTIVVDAAGVGEEMPASGFQGEMERNRLLEGTDSRLLTRLKALSEEDLEHYLVACPVLWSPEHMSGDTDEAFAYVGQFDRLRVTDRDVRYTFKPYKGFAAIPVHRLHEMNEFFRFRARANRKTGPESQGPSARVCSMSASSCSAACAAVTRTSR